MDSERVFAAAKRGEGVWAEVASPNSEIESSVRAPEMFGRGGWVSG